MARAVEIASRPTAPALLFIHVPHVDQAGHALGWIDRVRSDAAGRDVLSAGYLVAVRAADSLVARLWSAVGPAVEQGRVALVIAADHGGGHGAGCSEGAPPEREHCTAHDGDMLVPFVAIGRPMTAARQPGPARITQVASTVAALLGVARPAATDLPLQ